MRFTALLVVAAAVTFSGCASFTVSDRSHSPPRTHDRPGKAERTPPRAEPGHPARLRIPPGHLPAPGQCRIWFPGRPPGHQPSPGRCSELERRVPQGAWLLYRSTTDRRAVRVTTYDDRRPGAVLSVRLYDAESGAFIRVESR